MTPVYRVYEAFLSKILEDEWVQWTKEEVEADWKELMESAIPFSKFPRVSLEIDGDYFVDPNFSNEEVQIIANYMKCEWLNRTILTWENVKPLYEERDFSQANLLDKLCDLLEREEKKAEKLEKIYYRSRKGKPFSYSNMAGF